MTSKPTEDQTLLNSNPHLLSLLLNNLQDLVCICNFSGQLQYINPAIVSHLSYPEENLLKASVLNFVAPEDHVLLQQELETLKNGKRHFECELRILHANGAYRWVRWSGVANFQENIIYALGRDVTDHKQQELAIQEALKAAKDLKYALDQASLVSVTDRQGNIIYVNETFCSISKYTAEELLGKNHRIINSGYHPKSYFQEMWATISTGNVWKGEIKNKAKDGSEYWVGSTIIPFLDEDGRPQQYVSIRQDITEKKRFEEALKKNQERLNLIYYNTSGGYWDWNIQTGISYCSPQTFMLLGYPAEEKSVDRAFWKALIHPEDWPRVLEILEECITKPYKNQFGYEARYKTDKGDWRWILCYGNAIEFEADGKPLRMVGSHTDITEIKEKEEKLKQSEARFKDVTEASGEYIWEINTQGIYTFITPKIEDILGYSALELVGKSIFEMVSEADL